MCSSSSSPSPSSSTKPLAAADTDVAGSSTTQAWEALTATSSTVMVGILFTEVMTSFAYYGAQIILVLYLRQSLGFSESSSVAIFSFISSFADLSSTLGAALADGWLGRYKTILFFGGFVTLGLLITALGSLTNDPILEDVNEKISTKYFTATSMRKILSFVGLVLLFGGVRCIDPCLSSFGADQVSASSTPSSNDCESASDKDIDARCIQTEQQQLRVQTYFACFYFFMNLGALTSFGVIPLVREHNGFGVAFLLCSFCVMLGIACLVSKRSNFVYSSASEEDSSSLASTLTMCGRIVIQSVLRAFNGWKSNGWLSLRFESDTSRYCSLEAKGDCIKVEHVPLCEVAQTCCYGACDTESVVDKRALNDAEQALRVLPVLAMLPVFWMLYDQQESVWILQASRMTLHGLQPEQLCLVNPIEVSVFLPLFDQYVYPALTRRGWKIDPLARMGIGMLLAALSYLISGGLELSIQHAEARGVAPPSVFWQMIQITVMALSEIFVYVTGLEFAYSCAPARLKAFLVAIFSLTKAVGDLFGGILYSTVFHCWNRASIMLVCALLMIVNCVVFDNVANWFRSTASASYSDKSVNEISADRRPVLDPASDLP